MVDPLLAYIVLALWAHARWGGEPCDCLACQTGRPDYPCLIEENHVR